jgi:hemoglobin
MNGDIASRADIEQLVNSFYERVHQEAVLSPIFALPQDVWQHHVGRVVDFWDNWLFETGAYTGGMMAVHIAAHLQHQLSVDKFERWLALWFLSVDSLFEGPKADFAKAKALEVGQLMSAKLNGGAYPML